MRDIEIVTFKSFYCDIHSPRAGHGEVQTHGDGHRCDAGLVTTERPRAPDQSEERISVIDQSEGSIKSIDKS